jgi:hypothetical protein
MSKHIILNTVFVSIMGIGFGYGVTRLMHEELSTKLCFDEASFNYFDLKIENVSVGDKKDDVALVHVTITALQDLPSSLNYKWILGKDVTTGEPAEGTIPQLKQGDSQVLELRVQNYSKEWQSHVSIAFSGNFSGHNVQREVIVSSRPEDSFEYVVQQAAIAEKNTPPGQVQKLSSGKTVSEKFRKSNIVR